MFINLYSIKHYDLTLYKLIIVMFINLYSIKY